MAIWSEGNIPRSTRQSSDRHPGAEGHRQQPDRWMNGACWAALAGSACGALPDLRALLLVIVTGATLTNGSQQSCSSGVAAQKAALDDTQPVTGEGTARVLCTACHLLPPADVLPKGRWRDEIARMFLLRNNQLEPSGPPGTAARIVKLPPDWQSVLGYYEAAAPRQLSLPADWPAPDRTVPFERRVIAAPPGLSGPAVANIRLVDADQDGRLEIILSDMRSGVIYTVDPRARQPTVGRDCAVGESGAHRARRSRW